jgi:hypothetical protein
VAAEPSGKCKRQPECGRAGSSSLIQVNATDLKTNLNFYQGLPGLNPDERRPNLPGVPGFWINVGDVGQIHPRVVTLDAHGMMRWISRTLIGMFPMGALCCFSVPLSRTGHHRCETHRVICHPMRNKGLGWT